MTVEDLNDNPDVFAARIFPGQSTPLYAFLDTTTRAVGIAKSAYDISVALNKTSVGPDNTKEFQATLGQNAVESYNGIELSGNRATDRVCLTFSNCIKSLEFLYFKDKE